MSLRIAYLMTRRVLRDLFSALFKFSVAIAVIGFILWVAINYETFADIIGWIVASLVSILIFMFLVFYLMSVHDDVRKGIK